MPRGKGKNTSNVHGDATMPAESMMPMEGMMQNDGERMNGSFSLNVPSTDSMMSHEDGGHVMNSMGSPTAMNPEHMTSGDHHAHKSHDDHHRNKNKHSHDDPQPQGHNLRHHHGYNLRTDTGKK